MIFKYHNPFERRSYLFCGIIFLALTLMMLNIMVTNPDFSGWVIWVFIFPMCYVSTVFLYKGISLRHKQLVLCKEEIILKELNKTTSMQIKQITHKTYKST
mgnify:CR=1 FL=1